MLLIIGALCLVYYVIICIFLRKWNATFSRFWLAAGVMLPVFWFLDEKSVIPDVIKGGAVLLAVLILLTLCRICTGMIASQKEFDYLVVLGAQVRGRKITDSLLRRLDAAYRYLKEHPETKVIVSGGQGRGEDVTEAFAMAEYLLEKGIKKERIFLEDKSKTTGQNLKFSGQFLDKDTDLVGIVSNNFHLYRACQYAKRLGYQKVSGVYASCHPLLFVNYMMREVPAVWKLWISG